MSHRTPRVAALAGTAALALATLAVAVAPAQAHPAGDRAVNAGADWLVDDLEGGVLVGAYGPDIGLSIDAGLALLAVERADEAAPVAAGIAPSLVTTANGEYGYVRATEYHWETGDLVQVGRYANGTAKATAFATRLGLDPSTYYEDIDLVAQLEDLTDDASGLIEDDSSYGNYANSIGQAFAAEALTAVDSPEAAAATSALLQQQCASGYFRFALASTTCSEADTGDVDVTSLAVLGLVASGSTSPEVSESVDAAASWLVTQQTDEGSFGAGSATGINSNTTGLAGWALAAAGEQAAAGRAASWLRELQVADIAPCTTTLTAENGAIAYDAAALSTSRDAEGIAPALRDQYRRASAQALAALAHVPAGSGALAVAAPANAPERSTVTVTVSGLGDGEAGCLTLGGVAKPVTGNGSEVTVTFDLPGGPATHAVEITTIDGSSATASVTTTVTPPTTTPTTTPTTQPPTNQPPTPPTTPPVVEPSAGELQVKKVVKVHKSRFHLKVACESTTACEGRIMVRSTKALKHAPGQKARKRVVATRTYSVAPGKTQKVTLKVRKGVRRALAKGKVRVKAVQTVDGARRTITKFWLKKKR